jgi:predicted nuclease of restriction endonuclease-like (RecB) superfamily
MNSTLTNDKSYLDFLSDLKLKIQTAQVKAAIAVNRELILLYWEIGRSILVRQEQEGWGAKVIDRLSADLKKAFPDLKGFSPRNLKYMRSFAEAYPDFQFVQQVVAQIPWGHNVRIMEYVKAHPAREWYILKVIEHGWSRNVLVHQIETNLYHRKGQAITNFDLTLPAPQSDLAKQTLKDPYIFDFLQLQEDAQEREIEKSLIEHIKDFLLELGVGFSFVASQYHLEVDEEDFYIDLLFYHLKLRCYVIIDLKTGEFKPEYAGKINFYLSAIDDLAKSEHDNPSIGIVLCKTKKRLIVEYALRDMAKPIGVSAYQLTAVLPDQLKTSLPTIEQLEAELM